MLHRNVLKKVILKHSMKDRVWIFFKDVNACFKIRVTVPNACVSVQELFIQFFQNQRPERLAESLLTRLSLLEAWLNPLDYGKCPILAKTEDFIY